MQQKTYRPLVWFIGSTTLLVVFIWILSVLGFDWRIWATPDKGWTLFGRELWDWLDLLIVPAALAGGAYYFNLREQIRDREIAKERDEERALETYLGRMGDLLEKGLKETLPMLPEKDWGAEELRNAQERQDKMHEALVDIARTYTLTILRRLSAEEKGGKRKGAVVQFLYEAELISRRVIGESEDGLPTLQNPVMPLRGADLRGIKLEAGTLEAAHLNNATLDGANLASANLASANLANATLEGAVLVGANLVSANLGSANLANANLEGAFLVGAKLRSANLRGANLRGANLQDADLFDAVLVRAILPDGSEWTPQTDTSEFGSRGTPGGAKNPDKEQDQAG